MTQELPAPLTPVDCNLQDFAFMPLDVARLRDSDLAANESPEACWAAVQLWAASWHQIPAGSIPEDDKWMAKATGYGRGVKDWLKVRVGALRGFVMCTDGRLYHTVVAEKAREAWQAKIEQRYRTEVARVKKHNQRHETKFTVPEFDVWLSLGRPAGHHLSVPGDNAKLTGDNTRDKASKGQGEGQRQGDSNTVPNGTGAEALKLPADMTKDELWTVGKSMLFQQGTPLKQCGSIVGKLCKDYTDEVVLDALRTAVVERPADALTYIKAICMRKKGERQPKPNTAIARRVETLNGLTGPTHESNHAADLARTVEAA